MVIFTYWFSSVRPEAHIKGVRFHGGRIRDAEIIAAFLRQAVVQRVCQDFCVACFAAEENIIKTSIIKIREHFYGYAGIRNATVETTVEKL